ncbi:MAG: hypothetical protein H6865_08630 [Rhodospirillales bacterium]|nr:hypothetical protein [Alphaproteobacteria bacterium]MCB9987681.1 hypothetical protein [Rhodospirillales bacterium]USO08019.1 MAG: hypothetical protein H6866_02035 [Rhodospirillales bacterium]
MKTNQYLPCAVNRILAHTAATMDSKGVRPCDAAREFAAASVACPSKMAVVRYAHTIARHIREGRVCGDDRRAFTEMVDTLRNMGESMGIPAKALSLKLAA